MNILQLLYEAADLSSGEKILKAFEKGMVPGVKKKVFFKVPDSSSGKEYTQRTFTNSLENLAGIIKEANFGNNYNAAIFLILKKLGTYLNMRLYVGGANFTDWLDTVKAYFNHRNKQEVKTDSTVAKWFKDFENDKYHLEADKIFEQRVNAKFEKKASVKDESKEITTVYPKDSEGWEVKVPHTFAAAKRLACMSSRKAHWCTAVQPGLFKDYTDKGKNKLYIIRNEKKDIMFQMDWGSKYGANFKDEKDRPVKIDDFLEVKPPEAMLNILKDKDGKSLNQIIKDSKLKIQHITTEKGVWKEISGKSPMARNITAKAFKYLKINKWDADGYLGYYFGVKKAYLETEMGDSKRQAGTRLITDHIIIKNKEQDHYYLIIQGKFSRTKIGTMINPIFKFDDKTTEVIDIVSRAELEKDIGNLPDKSARMVATTEKYKPEIALKPIMTSGEIKIYKLTKPEDITQFSREALDKKALKAAKALGGELLVVAPPTITKYVVKKDSMAAIKLGSTQVGKTSLVAIYKNIAKNKELKKFINDYALSSSLKDMKKYKSLPYFAEQDERYPWITVYMLNIINPNSTELLRRKYFEENKKYNIKPKIRLNDSISSFMIDKKRKDSRHQWFTSYKTITHSNFTRSTIRYSFMVVENNKDKLREFKNAKLEEIRKKSAFVEIGQ